MKELPEACTEIENSLPLWVGGDLEPEAQKEVEDHLARCAQCSEKAHSTRLSRKRLLAGLALERKTFGSGPDPWPALRASLASEGRIAVQGRTAERGRGLASRRGVPLRTAAAAALLFGLVFAWTRFSAAPVATLPALNRGLSAVGGEPRANAVPVRANSGAVIQTAGLRPLGPGERLLRETAKIFDPNTNDDGPMGASTRFPGSPVGLQGAPAVPPR